MLESGPPLRFRTDLFPVARGEDAVTKPSRFGLALARWLCARFAARGGAPVEVIAEDWGFSVMLQREPFELFVGCTNLDGRRADARGEPPPQPVEWQCEVFAQASPLRPFWWRRRTGRASWAAEIARTTVDIEAFLRAEPRIVDLSRGAP